MGPKPYSKGLKRMQAVVGSPREFLAGASAIGAMVALDPAALVAAAVRGACLAKAPRRTVQAVAAAVVSVLVRPAEARLGSTRGETAKEQDVHEEVRAKSEEERREAIRAKRRARRQRKRAAQAAAANSTVREPKVESDLFQPKPVGNTGTAGVDSGKALTTVTPPATSTVTAPIAGHATWDDAFRAAQMQEITRMQTDDYMSDTSAKRKFADKSAHFSGAPYRHSRSDGIFKKEQPGFKQTRTQPRGSSN